MCTKKRNTIIPATLAQFYWNTANRGCQKPTGCGSVLGLQIANSSHAHQCKKPTLEIACIRHYGPVFPIRLRIDDINQSPRVLRGDDAETSVVPSSVRH